MERAAFSSIAFETTKSIKPYSPQATKNKSPMFKLPEKDRIIVQGDPQSYM